MNLPQILIQTAVTFVAATFGAIFGAFLTRWTERFKHVQELRSAAYVDFTRGFAKVANAQNVWRENERSAAEEFEGNIIVTDAKARICVYGSKPVLHALCVFSKQGSQTHTPEGMRAYTELCTLMRREAVRGRVAFEDVTTVLFGNSEASAKSKNLPPKP